MPSQKEIQETLHRILISKTFSRATTTNVLLKYLVESTLQNEEINALVIGEKLYGDRYDPEQSEANVRVKISHLRKRLAKYYEEEGKEETLKMVIKPGQYSVTFSAINQKKKNWLKVIVAVTSILSLVFVFFLSLNNKDKVWQEFFENNMPNTLYLCDVFVYHGPNNFGHNGWHRDARINSPEEFYEMINQNPDNHKQYHPSNLNFINFENTYVIKPLTYYFALNDTSFSLRSVSDFNTKTIKEQNTIYTGNFLAQTSISDLFNEFSKRMHIDYLSVNNKDYLHLNINNAKKDSIIDIGAKKTDGEYALASSFNGPNNTKHIMFFSNHGLGLNALVDYFTNEDTLKDFSKNHIKKSDEFIALFFVKGKERTNIAMKLVYFDNNK